MDAPTLEFVFEIKLELMERARYGPASLGVDRGFVGLSGGHVKGPALNGKIVPHVGGDFPTVLPDETVIFAAQYIIETDDGVLIELRNRGFRHGPKEVLQAMSRGEDVDPSSYYMRLAPSFDAPVGPYFWLTRTIFIGTAHRGVKSSVFRYWAVR